MLEAPRVDVRPTQLEPQLIGQLIGVQVIPRIGDGEVNSSRMIKYVGVLRSYTQDFDSIQLYFDGVPEVAYVYTKSNLVEFYQYVKVY